MHFRIQEPEDFQSSQNEWNFELRFYLHTITELFTGTTDH